MNLRDRIAKLDDVEAKDVTIDVEEPGSAPAAAQPILKTMSTSDADFEEDAKPSKAVSFDGDRRVKYRLSNLGSSSEDLDGTGEVPSRLHEGRTSVVSEENIRARQRSLRESARKYHIRLTYEAGEHIGAELETGRSGRLTVTDITDGSAASKAGLVKGARLVEANGTNLRGMSAAEVAQLLRGIRGTRHLLFSATRPN